MDYNAISWCIIQHWIESFNEFSPLWQEIRHLCSYLVNLKKASAEEMRKSVYANYGAFIRYLLLSMVTFFCAFFLNNASITKDFC